MFLCDADGRRVLPIGIFVEGAGLARTKFKSSVAAALHRRRHKGPKLEQLTNPFVALAPQASAIFR
jgi:hypothetical protein